MGIGVVIKDKDGKIVVTKSDMIKRKSGNTNNVAEHIALRQLLEYFVGKIGNEIYISGDSQMVINQATGRMKIKRGSYVEHGKQTLLELEDVKKNNVVFMRWIPREQNEEADALSKKAIGTNKNDGWVRA
jgi:ribonuclease HI